MRGLERLDRYQRHPEQELHPGHDAIAIGDAQTTLDQVQLEQANIIRRGCRRRALQIRREALAALDVASLRCWSEPCLSGSLPFMLPGGSSHRCRDFCT